MLRNFPSGYRLQLRSGGCVIQKLGRVQRRFNPYHPTVKLATVSRSLAAGKSINVSKDVHRIAVAIE
ncbi:adenylate/guanylate cyclase domain-containing protein [Devosia sp. 66-22]|uniref:adenylate/guanylate cyclase domain-containing protein n=1 Tax=Devosia sp. 66-22 TaxID=1895753 RepID=UPI00344B45A1